MDDAVTHHRGPYGGRYTIERELGRGGMATVYRALDLRHDRPVALKILHPEYARLGGERFAREIRLLAGLRHPNILPLFDSGEEDGVVFYVVPCIEGESLRRRLEREGQLPLEDAIRLTREIADALDYAHRQGIIHRDIKPENVLLEEGHAIVADFGVARAMTRAAGESQTTAGMVVGTVEYMSPEQASGDTEIDARTDQYSLACVLYEMLVGKAPFASATPRITIARRFAEAPPSLRGDRDVPEALDRAIRRALSPVPADRFPNVRAFSDALSIVPASPGPSRRTLAALGAPAAVAIAVALILWLAGPSGANTLDPGLYTVIPFAVEGSSVPDALNGPAVARHLGRSMGYWRDVRFVNAMRTNDAVQREGAPRTLRDALAIARDLGAGRLLWGDIWNRGDSIEVRAALYDVASGRELRSATLMMSVDVTNVVPLFDALSDSLALGTPRGRAAVSGARGTRVREAFLHYEAGHHALATWDLETAEREFRRASERDPEFAQTALWTAQSMAWKGADPASWRASAAHAVARRTSLDPQERLQAAGLLALAEHRFPDACEQYRAMLARDSLDFTGWHGLANCHARDPLVERDSRSPSGWRFRGSMHRALVAYLRAMEILPSFHRVGTQLSPLPTDLFPVEEGSIRAGYAVTPDTLRFAAAAGIDADTLSFVPYPMDDVIRAASGSWPATHASAVLWTRERLRRISETWVRVFPASSPAHEIHAASLEAAGDLARAGAQLNQARTLTTDVTRRARLAHSEVRVHVKRGDFESARRLADSTLAGASEVTPAEAHWLAGLAALTGRVHLTRRLLELEADDSTFAFWYEGNRITTPREVTRTALALLAYAAFPEPRDSTRALSRRLHRLIDVAVPRSRRERVRAAVMANAITFGLWAVDRSSPLSITSPGPLHRIQRALALGDTGAVRAAAVAVRRAPADERKGDADHLYHEALAFLAVGDTAAATLLLDDLLGGLPAGPAWLLEDVHRAAVIAPAMRTRALLAPRAGDDAGRTWAGHALTLWQSADTDLRPFLEPLAQIAREPNE